MSSSIPYYTSTIDGVRYIETFKKAWVSTHAIDKTGPVNCKDCERYGSLQYDNKTRIFIGYCFNCAIYIHKRSRGFGICLDVTATHYKDPPVNVDLFHAYLKPYEETILNKFYESQLNELTQNQKSHSEHTYDHFNADYEYDNKRDYADNSSTTFVVEHASYYNYL
jgi:hypothetical protein